MNKVNHTEKWSEKSYKFFYSYQVFEFKIYNIVLIF